MASTKYNKTAVLRQPEKDLNPRRREAQVTQEENRNAAIGVASAIAGVMILFVTAWTMWSVYVEWQVSWMTLTFIALIGCTAGIPLIYFGLLTQWRNTIDEWNEGQEKRRVLKYATELEALIEQREAVIADQKRQLEIYKRRLDDRIAVTRQGVTTEIQKEGQAEALARRWVTEEIFDEGGSLKGVYPKGKVKGKYPFGTKARRSPEFQEAHRFLVARGLIEERGSNYFWTGPSSALEAMEALT